MGGVTRFFALDALRVSREAPTRVSDGFDLDERLSDDTDPAGCFQPDFRSPDGFLGVDNQLAVLAPTLDSATGVPMDATLDTAVRTGAILLVLELRHLDVTDPASDGCVDVYLHDARTLDSPLPRFTAEGRLAPNQRFALLPGSARYYSDGRFVDGELSTSRTGAFPMLISSASTDKGALFDIVAARMRLRLTDSGLTRGLVGGALVTDGTALAFICAVPSFPPDLVRNTLASLADLDVDPRGDCQSMSATLTFGGVPALVP
jgi:hypothetical protein